MPAGSPGRRSGAKRARSMPRRSARARFQSPVRGSMSWVVEALVSSVPPLPREPVRDQIGDQQKVAGCGELRCFLRCHELVERVERGVLDSGRPVESVGRDRGPHPLRDAFGAPVPVVDGVAEEGSVGGEEPVVHRPAVDADGVDRARRAQPVEHAPVQAEDVPAQAFGQVHGPVGEAVGLGEVQGVRADAAGHDPPAGRAEVDGREGLRTGGAHRRKAAATPASTGMWRPVVWVNSPPVSAKTALATCSGSTSRLRRVRWA
ncbi:hypothetical protein GA0115255_111834 [Streptomyces sp. Ncost-T6T-2b]|nr:hypothetical protein GA0115255_111834 [Streptomyces sp. Ncost-T6T-2b]